MRIHAIQAGEVQIKTRPVEARRRPRAGRVLDVLTDRDWAPRLPISCYAIEHPDGVIVVDTGEGSHANDPGYQPWWHPFTRTSERRWVKPEEEIGPQLRALGVDPADVERVVMTHMHGDHAGGLTHFSNAEILMSAREAKMAMARECPLNGYLNNHYPLWLKPRRLEFDEKPWEGFGASILLTADGSVRLIPTPGHTLGHLSVVVDQGDHLMLITGDACYSERALEEGIVDGVAQSERLHRDTTRRLRELCERRPVVVIPDARPRRLPTPRRGRTNGHRNMSHIYAREEPSA